MLALTPLLPPLPSFLKLFVNTDLELELIFDKRRGKCAKQPFFPTGDARNLGASEAYQRFLSGTFSNGDMGGDGDPPSNKLQKAHMVSP